MCRDRQMGQNSMFFIIFGSILLLCHIFCTACLSFYSESFSPLLQICCNHEFNILSTAFNGMQFKLLTCFNFLSILMKVENASRNSSLISYYVNLYHKWLWFWVPKHFVWKLAIICGAYSGIVKIIVPKLLLLFGC